MNQSSAAELLLINADDYRSPVIQTLRVGVRVFKAFGPVLNAIDTAGSGEPEDLSMRMEKLGLELWFVGCFCDALLIRPIGKIR